MPQDIIGRCHNDNLEIEERGDGGLLECAVQREVWACLYRFPE